MPNQLTSCDADGHKDPAVCEAISKMLARIGDKWSILVVGELGRGPVRFNELRRRIGDISHKMLSTTLKALERDGLVTRTVTATTPVQVDYELTELGRDLLVPVSALAAWTAANTPKIQIARAEYDIRHATATAGN